MSQNRQPSEEAVNGFAVPVALAGDASFLRELNRSGDSIINHWHDVDQLIYAASGVATVETADGIWVVPSARAVWVPEATEHRIGFTGDVELVSVYVRPGAAPIDRSRCCVVHVSPLMRELILRGCAPGAGDRDDAAAHRLAVLFDEMESAGVAPLELVMPTDPRAREVAAAFLEDPSLRLSRAEWARRVSTSERTLERLFQRETSTTVGRWQGQARLLEALRLLALGENVTRVALEVGFDTPSAFIAMFRRALGTTPARYFTTENLHADGAAGMVPATLGDRAGATPLGTRR